jgi:hypothetical protein
MPWRKRQTKITKDAQRSISTSYGPGSRQPAQRSPGRLIRKLESGEAIRVDLKKTKFFLENSNYLQLLAMLFLPWPSEENDS